MMKKLIKKTIATALCVIMMLGIVPLNGLAELEQPELHLPALNLHLPKISLPDISSMFATKANAASVDDLTYSISDNKVTITGCNKSVRGELIIPETIKGYSVINIGYRAFYNCTGLTSITIPDCVTSIGKSAFSRCTELISITIGNSVTSIGDLAFYGCSGLSNITIPDSVISIGDYAFDDCPLEYVKIGSGLTNIPSTLINYKTIKSFIIGDNVKYIDEGAFASCKGLTSVTIGNGVTSIGGNAFYGCTGLTSVTIGNGVTSIGEAAFCDCTGLTSITLPELLTTIKADAFSNCKSLTGITIPNSVTTIGYHAFLFCDKLKSVTIPESVTSIGDGAFGDCPELASINVISGNTSYHSAENCLIETKSKTLVAGCKNSIIPVDGSVTSIKFQAFQGCTYLTSVVIPNSVTSIGMLAFSKCTHLTSATISYGVTNIGDYAFYNCSSLTSITIPNSVTNIGEGAFSDCTGLISATIPDSVTSIGTTAFYDCVGLINLTIPNNATDIGENAFYNVNNIYYYGSATGAPWGALNMNATFDGTFLYRDSTKTRIIKCKSTESSYVEIPSKVDTIEKEAFSNCVGLKGIYIPKNVTRIGEGAFENTVLTDVYYEGGATDKLILSIADNNTKLNEATWHYNSNVKGVCLYNETETRILFCKPDVSGYFEIPSKVDTIENGAFRYCVGLKGIYIPKNVTRIGDGAFENTALTDVYYEGSVVDKTGISFGDINGVITNATWHYNSKVSDMPSTPSNPDNPTNPETPDNPDNPSQPSADIPEANIIYGNSADNKKTYDYKTSVTFTAAVPEGGSVQWYVDGSPAGNGSTLTVKDKTNDYTVKVVVTDKNGNKTMDEEQVTIKHGFFDIIIWFFVHLFNPGAYDVKQ